MLGRGNVTPTLLEKAMLLAGGGKVDTDVRRGTRTWGDFGALDFGCPLRSQPLVAKVSSLGRGKESSVGEAAWDFSNTLG